MLTSRSPLPCAQPLVTARTLSARICVCVRDLKDDDEVTFDIEEAPEKLFAGKADHKPALLSFGRDAFVGKNSAEEDKRIEREKAREKALADACARDKLNSHKDAEGTRSRP